MKHTIYLLCLFLMGCYSKREYDTTHQQQDTTIQEESNRALQSSSEELAIIQPISFEDAPINPEALADFFPSLADGEFSKEIDLATMEETPRSSTKEGWYTIDRGKKKGFIQYQYLGLAENGWHGYLTKENSGGSLTKTAIMFVTLDGTVLKRQGAAYPDAKILNGNYEVGLEGNELIYTKKEAIEAFKGK